MPSNPNFVGGKLAEQLLNINDSKANATVNTTETTTAGGDKADDGVDNSVANGVDDSIAGGDRDATTTEFFNEINKKNNFYMNSHWVPSHDQPPQISTKYAKMFQKELFTLPYEISLTIPPHNDIHRKEIDV